MGIVALVPVGIAAYNAFSEGQTGIHKDDPARFDKAAAEYYAAIRGDTVSLCRLKYWGGRRGCASCGGTQYCGMATQVAKDYVEACFIVATTVLAGKAPLDTPAPPYPTSAEGTVSLLDKVAKWAREVSETSGGVATFLGNTPTPNTQQKIDVLTSPVVLIAVGVLLFFALRK
jgi:hypothetical protein